MLLREFRIFDFDELRLVDPEGGAQGLPRIVGHAAVFNSLSENLGGFREIIAPGAFADAIRTDDVRALFNHDPNMILGRNRAKPEPTMLIEEDDKGLRMEIQPPETTYARDLVISMRRGDVNQSSFQFSTLDDKWETRDGIMVRTVLKVKRLWDVSPVTFPAYPEADSGVRGSLTLIAEEGRRSLEAIARQGEQALSDPDAWQHAMDLRRREVDLIAAGL
jgi:HK97 family phage prohead protease